MTTTPILQNLIPLVETAAREQAASWLQGNPVIGGSPDDEIVEILARHDVSWNSIPVREQDEIRDVYLEAVKKEMASRIARNDSQPSGASSLSQVSPPSEPVKASPEAPVCEVEPLGEMSTTGRGFEQILFLDRSGQGCRLYQSSAFDEEWVNSPGRSAIRLDDSPHLSRHHVASLIAHLNQWLETGSFKLVPRETESDPKAADHPSTSDASSVELLREAKEGLEYALHIFQRSSDRGFYPWAALQENGGNGFAPVSSVLTRLQSALKQ